MRGGRGGWGSISERGTCRTESVRRPAASGDTGNRRSDRMREMPGEYHGREQTWLKHRVLEEYLVAWSHKLGSRPDAHLWYVDAFAGPWASQEDDRRDTSVAIGLKALNDAAKTWAGKGRTVTLHAAFIEREPRSFQALRSFVSEVQGAVEVHTYEGAFADHAATVGNLIGSHPAFVFVDPKGWDGVGLRHVAKLGGRPRRDLLVNVMYDHLNRFKDDERAFLRRQMGEFFGLDEGDLPPGLSEEELMALYRKRLRESGGMSWVADLAVPLPTRERTYFRLVVAGHHPRVIELFRDVEAKVIGAEAAQVRSDAKSRAEAARTAQLALLRLAPPAQDHRYLAQNAAAEAAVRTHLPRRLLRDGPMPFEGLWPRILCTFHLTLADLRRVVVEMERERVIEVRGRRPGERTVKEGHVIALPSGSQSASRG